jgi:hypothetical protein
VPGLRVGRYLELRGQSPAILSGVRGGLLVADAVGAVVAGAPVLPTAETRYL